MKTKNLIFLGMFFLFGILLISFASAYTYSNPQYTQPGFGYGGFGFTGEDYSFDHEMCEAGQDFVLQISPTGCDPPVVRSDLLEEQNAYIFCPVMATKINPLIQIEAIDYLTFKGDYAPGVANVGFHPARSALGYKGNLNSPVLENIGYAVIELKRQPVEAEMPDYVEGNITARIMYDIENAFGVGSANFYLKQLSDEEWEKEYLRYGFWKNRGYLRAENVEGGGAVISVYSGTSIVMGSDSYQRKIATFSLEEGEKSSQVYLPTFDYCMGGLEVKLDDVTAPGTTAKLRVNADEIEVISGEKFLNGRCWVVGEPKKTGINQEVTIKCSEDSGTGFFGGSTKRFTLEIRPNIELKINGEIKNHTMGDWLYNYEDKNVYLAYAYTEEDTTNEEDLKVILVAMPEKKDKLSVQEISYYESFVNRYRTDKEFTNNNFWNTVAKTSIGAVYNVEQFARWGVKGETFRVLNYEIPDEKLGKKITLLGVASPYDDNFAQGNLDYEKAMNDFDILIKDFPEQDSGESALGTYYGEEGLYEKIKLASDMSQKRAMWGFCQEFEAKYPGSELNNSVSVYCKEDIKISSSEISTASVLIDGEMKEISFEGVYEPGFNEYGAEVLVNFPDGSSKIFELGKKNIGYLEGVISEEYGIDTFVLDKDLNTKQSQDTDSILKEFVNCMDEKYHNEKGNHLIVTSFTDNDIYTGKCDPGSQGEIYNNDSHCVHEKNSCHYCEKNGKLNSRAVDLKSTGFDETKIKDSFNDCKGEFSNEYSDFCAKRLDEGNHIHVSIYCDCGGKSCNHDYQSKTGVSGAGANIKLINLDDSFAGINFVYTGGSRRINLKFDEPESFKGYTFTLKDINLKKAAKVSVIPRINYAETEADFKFKIGIEKRLIQLAPEKTKERIDNLNKSIEDFEKISNALGKTIKTMKTACIAAELGITVTNFFENIKGKGIARQEVMKGEGGWYEICADEIAITGKTMDSCLNEHSDDIDASVQLMQDIIEKQNAELKELQKNYESGTLLGGKIYNTDKFVKEKYSPKIQGVLDESIFSSLNSGKKSDEEINFSKVYNSLSSDGWDNGNYDVDDLRDIELYSTLLEKDPNNEMAKKRLHKVLFDVQTNAGDFAARSSLAEEKLNKINPSLIDFVEIKKDSKTISYKGLTNQKIGTKVSSQSINRKAGGVFEISENTPVAVIQTSQGNYIAILDNSLGTDKLPILVENETNKLVVFDLNGNKASLDSDEQKAFEKIYFKKYDTSDYENKFKGSFSDPNNPVVKFYETEPYKGDPAIVPFDLKNGWYAGSKRTLPVGANTRSYDDSAVVNSFYLCNVGENNLEENVGGDDICQMINLGTYGTYSNFAGLSSEETIKIVGYARDAIEAAQIAYKKGIKNKQSIILPGINENGRRGKISVKIGSPATDTPDIRCQDFMSPKECKIIFNLCDPVICPTSRCNFGGKYEVKDVIQTGLVGSVFLCLPNFKAFGGDVYVPVCLPGIKASADGWISIEKAYQDCLQESLDTGETVGICDEIHSIYLCEFFWKQGLPLVKYVIPKFISAIFGEGGRGGGEYLSIADAWETTSGAVNYFTQSYGINSYTAFKARSTEEVGGLVCKNFFSAVGPRLEFLFDAMTEPDSPAQFHGWFDEISYTTATVPPISQYKVFYHIYAGQDRGVYYKVYLKEEEGGSFYQDIGELRMVDSGYIPIGESATETIDFTAPSGYTKMCIMVNGVEECGFKQVSTSLAVDYVEANYLKQQALKSDIKTESGCISGSASLYNLINPNLQSAAESAIDPRLYEKGIIRVCATNNPGQGTDVNIGTNKSRWVEVGYCGDENIRCWLDKESVEDVIDSPDIVKFLTEEETANLRDTTLDEISNKYSDLLNKTGYYVDFKKVLEEIEAEKNPRNRISMINEVFDKVRFSGEKAKLFLWRGKAYAELAKEAWGEEKERREEERARKVAEKEEEEEVPEAVIPVVTPFIPKFEFEDGTASVNLCYKYFDDEWSWTNDCKDVGKEIIQYGPEGKIVMRRYTVPWLSLDSGKISGLNEKNQEFISQLKEAKNYQEGLKLLIDRTKADDEGGWGNPDLVVAENAEMDHKGIFKVYDFGDLGEIYVYYDELKIIGEEEKWYWNSDLKDVKDKNWKIMEALEGKDFVEGAEIMFSGEGGFGDVAALTIGKDIEERYLLFEEYFDEYSEEPPKGFNQLEFKALLVAISQQETGIGQGVRCGKDKSNPDPCTDWLMGYTKGAEYPIEAKGAKNQIRLASGQLKDSFSGESSYYVTCKDKTGDDKTRCVLSIYGPEGEKTTYPEKVMSYAKSWEEYFNKASGLSLTEKKVRARAEKCEDCGKDEHWYYFGFENICDKKECDALGEKLKEKGILKQNDTCLFTGKQDCITISSVVEESAVSTTAIVTTTSITPANVNEIDWSLDNVILILDRTLEVSPLENGGKYSDNKYFVRQLAEHKLLTLEELSQIIKDEKDMKYVRDLLKQKRGDSGEEEGDVFILSNLIDSDNMNEVDWSLNSLIDLLENTLEKSSLINGGEYSDNGFFVDQLYTRGHLTDEQWERVRGESFGEDEKDMKYVRDLLVAKRNS